MSSKLPAPALAALLTLAAIAPEPALAKRPAAPHHGYRHGYGFSYGEGNLRQPQIDDLNRGRPLRPGRPLETDPDPHIRFEMNRDDRDRRLGGS